MALTDKSEWRLLDTDLTTQLHVLPIGSSHFYAQKNAAGSGELKIPFDCEAAGDVTAGRFCQLSYRGSVRNGFFIENIKEVEADQGEGAARWVSVSGSGPLVLLERARIWNVSEETTRTFTNMTKAAILIQLIDEAQARGGLANLTYDFSATIDSAAVAWTDSESYSLEVGKSLLDVARQFAETGGFDFTLDLSAGTFNLGAYSAGIGSNISSTTYFRIGEQCEEVGRDERASTDLINAYLIKHQQGFSAVADATSITAHGRIEGFLNLEQAQSSASAITYASAKLAITKDPLSSKTLKVYDGIAPRLWVDYDIGDTISLDKFGTVTSDRILGIQADFDGVDFSHVTIELNAIINEADIQMSNALDNLLDQWTTARDANLMEYSFLARIGGPPGEVYAMALSGDDLYIGGALASSPDNTGIRKVSILTWETTSVGVYTGGEPIRAMCVIGANLYVAGEDEKIWKFDGTNWTNIGTIVSTGPVVQIFTMITDGTDLYVGGNYINSIGGVAGTSLVFKYTVSSGLWSAVGSGKDNTADYCWDLCFFGGVLYGAFYIDLTGGGCIQKFTAGAWSSNLAGISANSYSLAVAGSNLVIGTYNYIYLWDGIVSNATVIGTISGTGNHKIPYTISTYLTDIYVGGIFETVDGVSGFTNLAKYVGGTWYPISTVEGEGVSGLNRRIQASLFHGADYIFAGSFTSACGYPVNNVAAWMTQFASMQNFLQGAAENNFDLASAINNAPLNAVAAGDKFVFYDTSTAAISAISNKTGSGSMVFATSPSLVTPVLGVATAASINKVAITAPATSATLTIANGKTLTVSETLTLTAAAAGYTLTLPATGTAALIGITNSFTANQNIDSASNPTLFLREGGSTTDYFFFRNISTTQSDIGHVSSSGGAIIDINPIAQDGVSASAFRFFRSVNTSGRAAFDVYNADTTTPIINASISGNGHSYIAILEGLYLGVGVSPAAKLHILNTTSTANAILEAVRVEARVSTAATGSSAGFGVSQTFYAETATDGTNQLLGSITGEWATATNASRKALMKFNVYDTAVREGIRIEASGTAALISFFGGTAAGKGGTFVQTYSTATLTHANLTSTDPAAYGAGTNGYSTAAIAAAIHAEVIAHRVDITNVKQVVNQLIDIVQSFNLAG